MQVGNSEAAKGAAKANSVNIAAMLREMELLKSVVAAAVRLRAVGRAYDKVDEGMKELWDANPDMTRSATPLIMANQAFETAMKNFDEAVLKAFEAGMEWAPQPPLKPTALTQSD